MSKWNAWEDGPSRNPPDGARMSGPMADRADKAAIELLRSIGMQGGLYSLVPPVAVALRKARREGMEAAKTVIADLDTELETLRAREGEMRKALLDIRRELRAAQWSDTDGPLITLGIIGSIVTTALLTPASPGEGK